MPCWFSIVGVVVIVASGDGVHAGRGLSVVGLLCICHVVGCVEWVIARCNHGPILCYLFVMEMVNSIASWVEMRFVSGFRVAGVLCICHAI